MNYQKIYTDFYSKYYDKTELLLKHFFIKRKNQKRAFNDTYNLALSYMSREFISNCVLEKNEGLKELHFLFNTRYSLYEIDQEQEIFANELKEKFDKIAISKLPINYNYIKLIKDIAIIEAVHEVSRLLSCNSQIISMIYKLNQFKDFEIRYYKGYSIEDTPLFEKLHRKSYPHCYTGTEEVTSLGITQNTKNENNILSLFKNEDVYACFLEYQKYILDFYSDYSYLKKRLEQEKLIHYHKDNDFMKIVFSDLNLISEKNYNQYRITGKLKSLIKSYSVQRQNNFNIVFDTVL